MKNLIENLEKLAENPNLLAQLSESDRIALLTAAGKLSRPSRTEIRVRRREKELEERKAKSKIDRALRSETGIRKARQTPVFVAPKQTVFLSESDNLAKLNMNNKLDLKNEFNSEFESESKSESEHKSKPTIETHPESNSETQIHSNNENAHSNAQQQAEPLECSSPRKCYVCKAEFTKLHFFYDAMCTPCGDLNYKKRFQVASLEGRTALITGSRLKIGYHATLLMLRSGARVIATTRFPVDSASRFAKEEDFHVWKDRLEIYGLDLRHTPSVEIFAQYLLQHLSRLDIIIHNAAQTVRRPPAFYSHLMNDELKPLSELSEDQLQLLSSFEKCKNVISGFNLKSTQPSSLKLENNNINNNNINNNNINNNNINNNNINNNNINIGAIVGTQNSFNMSTSQAHVGIGISASAQLSQIPYSNESSYDAEKIFPKDKLDVDLQQVDLRETNSWRYKIDDVPTPELLEVQLVNAIAPFVLTSKLIPLMKKDLTGQKHIVNVTAMEGKFHRFKKSERHPHTNMAKAALNMLTHTASSDLAKYGIFMNAVDTGWVTDENPAELLKKVQTIHDFQPPLDIVDGAARICDPFFHGILTGHHWCGKFLKDYQPIDW